MSFTPSSKFSERWLSSPSAMREVIHGELSDIINLLDNKTNLYQFEFNSPNLHQTLYHLQTAHLDTLHQIKKQQLAEKANAMIPKLEVQLDEKLTERLDDLSDELKAWIRQAIKDELNQLDEL